MFHVEHSYKLKENKMINIDIFIYILLGYLNGLLVASDNKLDKISGIVGFFLTLAAIISVGMKWVTL